MKPDGSRHSDNNVGLNYSGLTYASPLMHNPGYEAAKLRDGDAKRFGGKVVLTAVNHIHTVLLDGLRGADTLEQRSNGGMHAPGGSDFQEFMVVPVSAPTFAHALEM